MVGNKENFSKDELRLIEGTRQALTNIEENIRVGDKLSDIAKLIEKTAAQYKLNVVKQLTGHGIRNKLHDAPIVLNYYNSLYFNRFDQIITDSSVLCVESIFTLDEEQQIVSKEMHLSAHFENTILLLPKEIIPLTKYLS